LDTVRVSAESVERAAADLAGHLKPTPLQLSRAFSHRTGAEVHLKLEGLQPVRSFKVRGALTRMVRMAPEERSAGVITASGGNHGMGVAYAAQAFGVPATVYVPTNANRHKLEAMREMGARVVEHGEIYQEAYQEARRNQGRQTFLHAYDDPDVVAGQGTVALEVLAELPEFDTVLVPVGGGGLIAGVAAYLEERLPGARVIGVEPTGAAALKASLDAGRPVTLERVSTIADGLAASSPGRLCFEIARRRVERVILVEDGELLEAIRLCAELEHLLVEPAGAAALAALLNHYRPSPGERVVVILSGANVTDEVLLAALKSG
jgi:threonine dehydratase